MKRVASLIIAVSFLLCACSVNAGKDSVTSVKNEENIFQNAEESVNAVWISYPELSELCKDADEEKFRERVVDLAANLLSFKINTAIVHAVAFCDSFYESEILPRSRFISPDVNYDVFGIICELCAKAGIRVQAWINPYRVSSHPDKTAVEENEAVKKLYSQNSESILFCENEITLNPALLCVQQLILDEARELIDKYNIDAIHIDDYFYPDMTNNPDGNSYGDYLKNNGNLSISDWRRENVNSLICSLHSLTHSRKIKLAISPSADIQKNYNNKYADILYWLENGWADEIIPQIYFGFKNENAPFEKILDNWVEATKDKPTRLIIGLAFYKCGKEDINAGDGKNEWCESSDIISRQISLIKEKNTIYGVAFFSYSHIFGKKIEKIAKKELQNAKNVI